MERLNHELEEEKRLKQLERIQKSQSLKQEYGQFVQKQKVIIKNL